MRNKLVTKQMFTMLLAGSMLLGVCGCGEQSGGSEEKISGKTDEKIESQSTSQSEIQSTTSSEGEEEEFKYPMDVDFSLSVWAGSSEPIAISYASYKESPYHLGLAERTGLDVEWIHPDTSIGESSAFNLMLTDKELPDMFLSNSAVTTSSIQTLLDDGTIKDLTDLIPKYAPDYWAYLNEPGEEFRLSSSMLDDGRMYGIQSFRHEETTCYTGPVIRKDWLDECGLDIPVTLEDFEKVLRTFKEKYGAYLSFRISRFRGAGMCAGTGSYAGFNLEYYVDENGKIQCANVQPEWKEYIETMHRWYEEGLLDPEFATMDDAGVRKKIMDGKVGMTFTAMSQLTALVNDAEASGSDAVFMGIGYPRVAEGVPTCRINDGSTASGGFMLLNANLSEEETIAALRWLNYGYTEEGYMYKNFGTEGVTYTLDENGNPIFTQLLTEDPDGMAQALVKYTSCTAYPIGGVQSRELVRMKNHEIASDAAALWTENSISSKTMLPKLDYTVEEGKESTDITSPISTYIAEMTMKFIMGEEDIAYFDEFVDEIYEMGIQDALDIMQKPYDRFISRLDRVQLPK